ncbi:hypothetical protein CCACVL1_06974 [Corchorus capsularis]|uniref:Uncharacterized protein n=1 Tax=Corchorus capsularis TaxID=210143 RepID=A0A1R3JAN1_COCAP|nr:hypothetical protein CCACVL1_06974 [Corchorus capsularis]
MAIDLNQMLLWDGFQVVFADTLEPFPLLIPTPGEPTMLANNSSASFLDNNSHLIDSTFIWRNASDVLEEIKVKQTQRNENNKTRR